MSLEDKIKKAFKRDKKLTEANRYDPEVEPNLYELNNFLRKSGYRLISVLKEKGQSPDVLLEPIKKGHLYPDIFHDTSDGKFYIKVISYGLLEQSDVEGIITGYQNALAVVKHLDALDLSELEVEDEE